MTAISDPSDENVRHVLTNLTQTNVGVAEVKLVKEVPADAAAQTYRQRSLFVKALARLSEKLYEAYVTLRTTTASA